MSHKPLTHLQIIPVRYRNSRFAEGDDRSLEAYAAADVYSAAGIPTTITEPRFNEAQRSETETVNLGIMGGEIAQLTAAARQAGQGVLMSGGDCTHITGIVGGLQDAHGADARIGLIWFDAHGDFNTPHTTMSGMLGGMPVAVCAGLAFPRWREGSHIAAPLPTDRILMVDVRNLDPAEEQLVRSTDIVIAAPAEGFPGVDLAAAVNELAERCDYLYFHIDSDILDERFVPNHGTKEPDGPDMAQVKAAIDTVMATGKVAVYAVVSVYGAGEGYEISQASGIELIRHGLVSWQKYGGP